MFDVIIMGAGPAGITAAERAAELGAKTALITKEYVGGMAANDGPVPVRTLAHAARLVREANQLAQYGIEAEPPSVNYQKLMGRVQSVVYTLHEQLDLRGDLEMKGVAIYEQAGEARFVDPHTIEMASGQRLSGKNIIVCTGGRSRSLPIPGFEHAITHSDAWNLTDLPDSMAVIGSGATGAQVASIFNAFGTRVSLFELAPRILMTEDEDVSTAIKAAFEAHGMTVIEGFEGIEQIEKTNDGIRFRYKLAGQSHTLTVSALVMAVGWLANAEGLNLKAAGVATNRAGYIQVNEYMQTNVPHIFAAGDVNGQSMLVPTGSQEGYYAASNAVNGLRHILQFDLIPTGSYTDPEYAKIGLTEAQAREQFDVVAATIGFDSFPRSIIDGRTTGFCKLIADRQTHKLLGCHLVGERAVETVQLVAAGMKAGLTVSQLADLPLSFPTYVEIVGWAAYDIVQQLGLDGGEPHWAAHSVTHRVKR
ncbi:MAG: NAD(P)/FAD-dependent oxidoreductase [Anaerolineae bacterium]|nr:NAD(P)/FAD-dependent oxidoreductase [Anaerolineae bacterium]